MWAKPDAVEKDVTVTMTLKNISSATIKGVLMSRSGDFDVGDQSARPGSAHKRLAWLWVSATLVSPPGGLMLTALSFEGRPTRRESRPRALRSGTAPRRTPALAKVAAPRG